VFLWIVFFDENSPTYDSCARQRSRKTDERRLVACMLPAGDEDVPIAPTYSHDEVVIRLGQTHQSRQQRCPLDTDDTAGLLFFFAVELWII
jgi:hypothetical protein